MSNLLKYLLTLFVMMPALGFAQLNSDFKLIKRKKIKTVYAYNLTKSTDDTLRYDTAWTSYSYNRSGKIISICKGQGYDFEEYIYYNQEGYITSILSREWETIGITKSDTTAYYIARFNAKNSCTMEYRFNYDHEKHPSSIHIEAYKSDIPFVFPTLYSDNYLALYKNADYFYEDYNIINKRGYLVTVNNDTTSYYELNTWDELKTRWFVVTEKTDSGYVARSFYQKQDSVFYDAVYAFVCSEENSMTYFSKQYQFTPCKEIFNLNYDPLHPKLEDKVKGYFASQTTYLFSMPSTLSIFLIEKLDLNGHLIKHIDLQYEPLPPFTKEFQQTNSLKALRTKYENVVITERY